MNSLFSKSAFALINVAALAVCGSALAVKAETGNLPDSATTATLPAQNIDLSSEASAFSEARSTAETNATNKIIDSIDSIALNTEVAPAPAEQAVAQPAETAPAQSETANSESVGEQQQNAATDAPTQDSEATVAEQTATVAERSITAQPTVETAQKLDRSASTVAVENSQQVAQEEREVKTAREVLETPVSTSASALTNKPQVGQTAPTAAETPKTEVAQDNVRVGRSTRSGPSYIGIGGNLGFGGDSALGDSSFAVISKIGLTTNFSVRPTVLFRDELTILVPVTYDFVSRDAVEVTDDFVITAAPYLGAGVAVSTGDNGNLGFLISGGVDVPLSSNFTATAGLNVGFLDGAEVGLLLGVGYTFPQIAR
ncbi:MAG: hypothetical protein HC849_05520 [Oscillatoriales cyanobacterium RU_3_3]|nr:hypothetical protein [Oscillatoriales cyanobacterium RU_3_3]NJR24690.1 hypothetical protein [Richelia sp. CSU_2_1]